MKRLTFLALIALILAACSAQPEPAANQEALTTPVVLLPEGEPTQIKLLLTSDYLNTEFEDAASLKNQLAYGTLLLEETEFAVTTDQAQILLPLYQAMVALTGDNNSVSEELNAVQNQVLESMTPEQSQKIAELQINKFKKYINLIKRTEKKSRKGKVFYGCDRWPDCDFALWDKPTGKKCPECNSLLVQDKKGKIKCSNKDCFFIEKK